MRDTIIKICQLQPEYSPQNTPAMRERGHLVRKVLVNAIQQESSSLSKALGEYGGDFHIDASDGIGRKTELPWLRFCSKRMSPSPTEGFYCVLFFSTDGSAFHIAISCSSSRFKEGYSVVLPSAELDKRTEWAKNVVQQASENFEPFVDPVNYGAKRPLPKSFERATVFVKTIAVEDLDDNLITGYLVQAAGFLKIIYDAQRDGRELSHADQAEIEIIGIAKPTSKVSRMQGIGLTSLERKAVEIRAMDLAETWLKNEGYIVHDTSLRKPYDFEAKKDNESLLVEVKGTTSDNADAIMMTHGEVGVHQSNKGRTALIIVNSIRLDRTGNKPAATGGVVEVLLGWDIGDWIVEPTAFRVSRKRATS